MVTRNQVNTSSWLLDVTRKVVNDETHSSVVPNRVRKYVESPRLQQLASLKEREDQHETSGAPILVSVLL